MENQKNSLVLSTFLLLQTDRKLIEVMSLFGICVIQSISENQVMKLSDICLTERAFKTEINIKQNEAFYNCIQMAKCVS